MLQVKYEKYARHLQSENIYIRVCTLLQKFHIRFSDPIVEIHTEIDLYRIFLIMTIMVKSPGTREVSYFLAKINI